MAETWWRIRERTDDAFALDQDGKEILTREDRALLVMYIFAASVDNRDVIEWTDDLGCTVQTVAECKASHIKLQQRLQETGYR